MNDRERRAYLAAMHKPTFGGRFGRMIDNALGVLAPRFALKREAARYARDQFRQLTAGAYRGANSTRLKNAWTTTSGSADQDILPDLDTLRERSRELNRDDGFACGITESIVTNVVGDGIKPQSRVDPEAVGLSQSAVDEFQKRAEDAWNRWIEFADLTAAQDFYRLQSLVERKRLEDGDVLAMPLMDGVPGSDFSLAIQIIEADRLATPTGRTGSVRGGVEIDSMGRPVKYYIRKAHPGNTTIGNGTASRQFAEVEAFNSQGRRNVFHLFDRERPEQNRGVPLFSSVLSLFHDLSNYVESELVSARVGACYSAFITKSDPAAAMSAAASGAAESDGSRREGLEPGLIEYLAPGESVTFGNPTRPGATFDAFVIRILRAIAAGVGISYELVARDYSKVNFSSARAAILEDRRGFRVRQARHVAQFSQPVWEMVLEEAFLRGELGTVPFMQNRDAFTNAVWNPPGWQWVDPLKEVQAAEKALSLNLTTLADELSSQGKDYEEVLRQVAKERALMNELGIKQAPASAPAFARSTPAKDNGGSRF